MDSPQQSIQEIDFIITDSKKSLSTLPRCHPRRPACLNNLFKVRLDRYELSNEQDDLDKAILHLTESILLQPRPSSPREHKTNIIPTLFNLALALYQRSNDFKQSEDSIYAAKYLRHLRDQPQETFGFPLHDVTALLVDALVVQVKLGAGDIMHNIAEMAALCCELFTLDVLDDDTTHTITRFALTIMSKIRMRVPDQPLDQLIECLRAARIHKPNLREARFALAISLSCRYCMTFVNDDHEEAVAVLDEIIASGGNQDKFMTMVHEFATRQAIIRSKAQQNPEFLEEAIYRASTFLGAVKEPIYPILFDLENIARQRFGYFGSVEGPEESSDDSLLSRSLPAIANDDSEFGRINKSMKVLLSGILNNADITKIDGAIEEGRAILASCNLRLPRAPHPFAIFGDALFEAFTRTKNIDYLNESISICRQVLECPLIQPLRFATLGQLSLCLIRRSGSFPGYCARDLDEALELLSQCVNDGHVSLPERFQAACTWAYSARHTQHCTVSTAYESALSMMQDTLLFAPTLQLQHVTLARFDDTHRLPLDYVSYLVDLGELEGAIETLERGRAVLWSEMRYLRTSVDLLMQADPQLGHQFAGINRDLEELTKSIPPSHNLTVGGGGADDLKAVDPFGRLLLKQRRLLEERSKLISQIKTLPGLDTFLVSPSFDTLSPATSSGPVIIINHSIWRSDIIILLHETPPSLIPTHFSFYLRAKALKEELLEARNTHGPDSDHYNETLAHVLKELYDLVGKPVIDRLRQLNIQEQSRVWWCPTSVFCSLPFHAMGPIPSDGGGEDLYFLDIYIPSYTPTLSALVEPDHREPGSPTPTLPSLLLVAHFDVPSPDVSLSEVCEDVKVVQALNTRLPVKSLISESAKSTSVLDSLRDHQFIHFVCHCGEAETPGMSSVKR